MQKSMKYILPATLALTLTACGGSSSDKSDASYSGLTSPASFSDVSQAQKNELGNDTATVISDSIDVSDSSGFVGDMPLAVSSSNGSPVHALARKHINGSLTLKSKINSENSSLAYIPVGATESMTWPCDSGETIVTVNGDENSDVVRMEFTHKNCKQDDEYYPGDYDLTNGTLIFTINYSESSNDGSMLMEFKNFKDEFVYDGVKETSIINGYYKISNLNISNNDEEFDFTNIAFEAEWNLSGTDDGKPFASKGNMTCTASGCTVGATIKSDNGKTYKVEDFKVSTDANGYVSSASGTIYHPDYGHYSFTADITDTCYDDDAAAFAGTATLTDESGNTIIYTAQTCSDEPVIQ